MEYDSQSLSPETFLQMGLVCYDLPNVSNLEYEAPVNINSGMLFLGHCSVGAFTYFNGRGEFNSVSFGRYCSVAPEVRCSVGQHHTNFLSTHPFVFDPGDTTRMSDMKEYANIKCIRPPQSAEPIGRMIKPIDIVIGNDVWLGQRAMIMNGVSVGDGAVVAAGAIVTKNVEPYTIVAGVPAKPIRKRFPEQVIERLLKIRWWDYDLSVCRDQLDYSDITMCLDFFEEAVSRNLMDPFKPAKWELTREGMEFSITRLG